MSESRSGAWPRPGWSRWRAVASLVVAALALGLTWRLAARISWAEVLDLVRGAHLLPLLAAVACLTGRFVAGQARWSLALARLGGRSGLRLRFFALMAAVLVNHLTPSVRLLGGVFRARYLARLGSHSFARHYGAVLVDQVSHQIVQGTLTWGSFVYLAWAMELRRLALAVALAPPLAALALLAWRARSGNGPGLARRLLGRLARPEREGESLLRSRGREVLRLAAELLADLPLQLRMALLGVAILLFNVAAQWLVFRALGAEVGAVPVAVATTLGLGAGVLAGTPGGLGATEAALIACYGALGVDRLTAVAGTLVYRGLHYLLVLALGLPPLLWFELGARPHPTDRDARGAAGMRATSGPPSEPGSNRAE